MLSVQQIYYHQRDKSKYNLQIYSVSLYIVQKIEFTERMKQAMWLIHRWVQSYYSHYLLSEDIMQTMLYFFRLLLSIPDIKIIILSCYSLQPKWNSTGTIKPCKTKHVSSQTRLITPLADKKADHQSRNKHINPEGTKFAFL